MPPCPARSGADTSAPSDRGYEERVHRFGDGLVGVATFCRRRAPRATALILLNAGLVPRWPFRYVQMARRLAAEGYVVLRFDQSGLGDSPLSSQHSDNRKRDEVRAAMDLLEREAGVRRFVLGGICSGADDSFNIAPLEPRVAGLVLLDGVSYRTRGHKLRHYLPRLLNPLRVLRALWRRQCRGASRRAGRQRRPARFPHARRASRRCWRWTRGCQVLLLYTGGWPYHNHLRRALELSAR